MSRLFASTLVIPALVLTGCVSMAPRYERPATPVAGQWRDAATAQSAAGAATTDKPVADIDWQEFFQEERLRKVIALTLDNNRDLRIAMLNIEKARAQYRIQRAGLLPSITANGAENSSRSPASLSPTGVSSVNRQFTADVGFSNYELDLFGRIRSLKNEALENYLATEETQRSTRLSLVAEVAGNWLTLAADRQLLKLAQETFNSQLETLKRVEYRHQQGIVSGLDLAQVQTSVESARADVASFTAQVQQDRNALELVVGAAVADDLLPQEALDDPVALAQIPANLDSSVLLQRPDVLSAEHSLKAANANIGAARAAFFPTISLTGALGRGSNELSTLFDGVNRTWSFVPSLSMPIFNAGSLRASLKVSEVERNISLAQYEKAIQTAFGEVADALAVRTTLGERLNAQQALVNAATRSYTLSDARYRNGVDSYLNALDSQRSLYTAQQSLINLQLIERSNRVTLYKVLGGGVEAGSK